VKIFQDFSNKQGVIVSKRSQYCGEWVISKKWCFQWNFSKMRKIQKYFRSDAYRTCSGCLAGRADLNFCNSFPVERSRVLQIQDRDPGARAVTAQGVCDIAPDPLFVKIFQDFSIKQGVVVSERRPYRWNPTVTPLLQFCGTFLMGCGFRS
jgi:hypothetical protein